MLFKAVLLVVACSVLVASKDIAGWDDITLLDGLLPFKHQIKRDVKPEKSSLEVLLGDNEPPKVYADEHPTANSAKLAAKRSVLSPLEEDKEQSQCCG